MKPYATKGFNNKATFGNVILQIHGVVTAQSSGSYNFKGALSALNDRYDFNPQPWGVRTIPAEISTRFGAMLPGRPYGIEFVGSRAIDESGP
jgi:hypothetical protein